MTGIMHSTHQEDERREDKRREWTRMELRLVGEVAEVIGMTTAGSKRDSTQGCGQNRRRTGTGTPC